MSSSSASASPASDAVAANERIRALVDAAETSDGTWPAEAYEVLLLEWAAALHDRVDEAA
ncbi:hypothetical protein OIE62_08420 [Streptomyces scopuliridis]|uniref:Uncharacterized protein n=2 Tax=Streptomyces scopuliridis TaxID=452529 RepID=A0A2T7SMN0_9ACTN|nr:hypothetical protein [Streptomyces scopuliridis]PVE04150.1 hypothetical protein Y717_13870 [Streptomyces scopuliridis RB72]WSB37020.1 hypothetical protein OG949_32075 [Streptomyces scopuliridis]WSC01416.1 hypothetical protein OG835_33400 [Streptomyces scopuliridis]WSC05047.1 hypothetical protein OIE62_08420 [Streptomyces scopuliridis]